MNTKEKLEKLRTLAATNMKLAQVIEDKRLSGIARLKKFPLILRILLYPKFNVIRRIIKNREMYRCGLVIQSLGMIRAVRNVERKLRDQGNN